MIENEVTDLMLKILMEDERFQRAMADESFRETFEAFMNQIYSYGQSGGSVDLRSLEDDFLKIYESMDKYIKEDKENESSNI